MVVVLLGITTLLITLLTWICLKSRSFYHQFPGYKGNWFYGNMHEIRNSTIKQIVEKFPTFYRFSKGFCRYRISCYHPELIGKVMKNSDDFLIDFHFIDTVFKRLRLQESTGHQWKVNRDIHHYSYGIQTKNSQTNICRQVFFSFIDTLKISDGNSKSFNINEPVSKLIYECSNKIWFGKDIQKWERSDIKMMNTMYDYYLFTKLENCAQENNNLLMLLYRLMKIYMVFKRLEYRFGRMHDYILKKRKRQILLERNKEYNGILNRLILAEMNGKYKLKNADYTILFKSHHTIVDTLGTEIRTWMCYVSRYIRT